jgi:hypothetical protein
MVVAAGKRVAIFSGLDLVGTDVAADAQVAVPAPAILVGERVADYRSLENGQVEVAPRERPQI